MSLDGWARKHEDQQQRLASARGFTLVELIVTIAIVMVVMGVVFMKNDAFSGAVGLRNQAYEVAFAIREAQLLAVSANESNPGEIQRYGAYFTSGTKQVIIFQDQNNDRFYDASETVKTITISPEYQIERLVNGSGSILDNDDSFAIVFEKPNFDARFVLDAGSVGISGPVNVVVRKVNTSGNTVEEVRWIEVTGPGQISVEAYGG